MTYQWVTQMQKVGTANEGWERVIGREGMGTLNENWLRLAEMCALNNLVICVTLYKHLDSINSHGNLLMEEIGIKSTM